MKKRYLVLVMVLALVLCACGGPAKEEVSGSIQPAATEAAAPEAEVSGTVQPAETEPAATERPVSMGRLEGGVYTNSYTGYGCNLDSSWTYYSAEELQDMPEAVKEAMEGSELGDSIDTLNQFTDMMAENVEALTTMNVLYQKLSMEERLGYAMLDEAEVLELLLEEKDMMVAGYAQAGFEVESMETVTVSFLGRERTALKTSCTTQGVPYYTLQLFDFALGQYSVTLTLASFVEDNTAGMLELFYPVS